MIWRRLRKKCQVSRTVAVRCLIQFMSRSNVVLLFVVSTSLFSQKATRHNDAPLVSKAKNAIISTLDPALPNVTLESFLRYETKDPGISWRVLRCNGALAAVHTPKRRYDEACVQTLSDLQDGRVVEIVLRVSRETSI